MDELQIRLLDAARALTEAAVERGQLIAENAQLRRLVDRPAPRQVSVTEVARPPAAPPPRRTQADIQGWETVSKAAKAANISASRIYSYVKSNDLKSKQINGQINVHLSDLRKLIAERGAEASKSARAPLPNGPAAEPAPTASA